MTGKVRLAVGGYDPAGLAVFDYDVDAERLHLAGHEPRLALASYGARLADGRWCFVEERKDGGLHLARPTSDGWRIEGRASSGGSEPCFVDLDPQERALAVANYASGEVSLAFLDGALAASPAQVLPASGRGPNLQRQEGPHAHCARFGQGRLYRTDLGTDQVLVHDYDVSARKLSSHREAFKAPPGDGPRHLLFHPQKPIAWLLTEMGSRLFTLAMEPDGSLAQIASLSTLPAEFSGDSLGGHLELDAAGRRLYVTNRGHDSIALFELEEDGRPRMAGVFSCPASSPRHFALLEAEGRVILACEEGDAIVALELAKTGEVGALCARAATKAPAFVARLD